MAEKKIFFGSFVIKLIFFRDIGMDKNTKTHYVRSLFWQIIATHVLSLIMLKHD